MRFSPPPNWPPTPPGWTPDPNWRPDPSWPPAPPGWQFWVDDFAPQPGPPGYPPPFPVPPPPKSRNGLWLGLAAIAAVVVVIAGSIWYFGGGALSKKRDITTLTKDLLLDRSQFSGFEGDEGGWISHMVDAESTDSTHDAEEPHTANPKECTDLGQGIATGAQVGFSKLSRTESYPLIHTTASVAIPEHEVDLKNLVEKCREFTITSTIKLGAGPRTVTSDWNTRPLDLHGLPQWAVAYSLEPDLTNTKSSSSVVKVLEIEGYCRGVLVVAAYEALGIEANNLPDISDKLAQLFNAQVAKLEAAP